jgi:hypothetical protein
MSPLCGGRIAPGATLQPKAVGPLGMRPASPANGPVVQRDEQERRRWALESSASRPTTVSRPGGPTGASGVPGAGPPGARTPPPLAVAEVKVASTGHEVKAEGSPRHADGKGAAPPGPAGIIAFIPVYAHSLMSKKREGADFRINHRDPLIQRWVQARYPTLKLSVVSAPTPARAVVAIIHGHGSATGDSLAYTAPQQMAIYLKTLLAASRESLQYVYVFACHSSLYAPALQEAMRAGEDGWARVRVHGMLENTNMTVTLGGIPMGLDPKRKDEYDAEVKRLNISGARVTAKTATGMPPRIARSKVVPLVYEAEQAVRDKYFTLPFELHDLA